MNVRRATIADLDAIFPRTRALNDGPLARL